MADFDIERMLEVEASAVQKDAEVERIMACFKLDPYDILELDMNCVEKDIKMAYRRKSLMIHPDKVKHPKAQDAFDLLKKAEMDLMDPGKRSFLNSIIEEAKYEVKKAQPLNIAPTDPFFTSPVYKSLVKQKTKDLLIEAELRKRKLIKKEMEAEGAEARKQDEVISERKRKQEAQKVWEDSRDDRVQGWRNFQAGKTAGGKIKRKKPSTFRPPRAVAEESAVPYNKRPTTSSATEGF
ncbi:DnaJ-domain-containing protein [Lobosporangium transversale]|uniref:DnaJ-domain-containing protein n=1 Tax=Lobosporangium transversale TaxID=64571 RepID=A0A1Y2GGP1_9FUNG|nr:DnaJ-domain-containing protein [Lobosporangium transversale]ORZ07015.1 DnaJ-domain-containing protein [Lobosporangium transversale]|eukprot:XP_021877811.1 DnaJ-domain-containing protein [Lobosporangium transversale]